MDRWRFGCFWLVFETRPYMRSRAALPAEAGRIDEAIAHDEVLIDLKPNDNIEPFLTGPKRLPCEMPDCYTPAYTEHRPA